jgi:hypothetical protein
MATAQFLNVDLDLHDRSGVRSLVAAFEPKLVVLHKEETFASLELATGTTPPLDEVLNGIAEVVEALPRQARTLWDRCQRRTMNLGFEAGDTHPSRGFVIPGPTLTRLASVGAELEVTIYASSPGRKRSGKRTSRKTKGSRR